MSTGSWVVEAFAAYTSWSKRRTRSAVEKAEMSAWIAECERSGPPPTHEVDAKGNHRVSGPDESTIWFRRFEFSDGTPGYMYLLRIDDG
jgi:hypothetical protein